MTKFEKFERPKTAVNVKIVNKKNKVRLKSKVRSRSPKPLKKFMVLKRKKVSEMKVSSFDS